MISLLVLFELSQNVDNRLWDGWQKEENKTSLYSRSDSTKATFSLFPLRNETKLQSCENGRKDPWKNRWFVVERHPAAPGQIVGRRKSRNDEGKGKAKMWAQRYGTSTRNLLVLFTVYSVRYDVLYCTRSITRSLVGWLWKKDILPGMACVSYVGFRTTNQCVRRAQYKSYVINNSQFQSRWKRTKQRQKDTSKGNS